MVPAGMKNILGVFSSAGGMEQRLFYSGQKWLGAHDEISGYQWLKKRQEKDRRKSNGKIKCCVSQWDIPCWEEMR